MSDLPYKQPVPQEIIDDVRLMLGDSPELNKLIPGTEVSDEKIRLAVQLWVQYFNNFPPILEEKYSVTNFPSYLVMFHGVIIELLKMSGMVHSRNFLNFSDNGVQFTVNDKASDYMQWIQNYLQTHSEDIKQLKIALNAEAAFGFYRSPEGWYADITRG